MKLLIQILIGLIAIGFLVNKFYALKYCKSFSGKAVQYSLWATDWMKKCQNKRVCKIGSISNNNFWWIRMKNWKCVPTLGEIKFWE